MEPQLRLSGGVRRAEDPLATPPTLLPESLAVGMDPHVISDSTASAWLGLEQVI